MRTLAATSSKNAVHLEGKVRRAARKPHSVPQEEVRTLAHEFLDIEAEDFKVPQKTYDTLDKLLAQASKNKSMRSAVGLLDESPEKLAYSIFSFLNMNGFYHQKNGLLAHALQNKKLYCAHYSVLNFAIIEQLAHTHGIKITPQLVYAPEHVFLRCTYKKKGFNIETTEGAIPKDKYYRDGEYHPDHLLFRSNYSSFISPTSVRNGTYLKSLTRIESKGLAHFIKGWAFFESRDLESAEREFTCAIKHNSKDVDAYISRGDVKHKRNDSDGALADYAIALMLDPRKAEAYHNRALVRYDRGDFKEAIKDYLRTIKFSPQHEEESLHDTIESIQHKIDHAKRSAVNRDNRKR